MEKITSLDRRRIQQATRQAELRNKRVIDQMRGLPAVSGGPEDKDDPSYPIVEN